MAPDLRSEGKATEPLYSPKRTRGHRINCKGEAVRWRAKWVLHITEGSDCGCGHDVECPDYEPSSSTTIDHNAKPYHVGPIRLAGAGQEKCRACGETWLTLDGELMRVYSSKELFAPLERNSAFWDLIDKGTEKQAFKWEDV